MKVTDRALASVSKKSKEFIKLSRSRRGRHTGNKWRHTREAAITRIESKTEAFYTVDKATGKRIYIGVVREAGKAPYLRTHADGKWNDNLLAQGECGADCRLI
ncbi:MULTISPECIES: DUF3892 domain-containing protein [unclassified Herbaspirillum]|uniref:DUF3892 domain-containing protein n=1 Tax=unclassified Herbaspirillum TaxID=2624150 RepID=UPI001C5CA29B|nr:MULTISPECIES: DUF3892 domain-containing protein [unclassified Herbaspirillum]